MPLCNVIDRRKRPYRFANVNAVIEPTCHDNSIDGADQAEGGYAGIGYDEKEHVTVAHACKWAQSFDHAVTLYLYDEDGGIYAADDPEPVTTSKEQANG